MFILIPVGVEGNEVRVPVVCIGVVALCLLGFVGTWLLPSGHGELDREALRETFKQLEEHPYLTVPDELDGQLNGAIRQGIAARRASWVTANKPVDADVVEREQDELNGTVKKVFAAVDHSPFKRL